MNESPNLLRRAGVAAAELGSSTMLFDLETRRLHELNESAAVVWGLLDGRSRSELITAIAAVVDAPEAALASDIDHALAAFDEADLLGTGTPREPETPPQSKLARRLAELIREAPGVADAGTFCAGEFHFRLLTDHPEVGRELTRVLGSLRVVEPIAPGTDIAEIALVGRSYGMLVAVDGDHVIRRSSAPAAVAMMLWKLNQLAVAGTPDCVALHAGAVGDERGLVVMPGRSNAGKSTLVTGLVEAGLGYVTDEATLIRPDSLAVVPYPKAIALDPGSFAVFPHLRPAVAASFAADRSRKWHLEPAAVGSVGAEGPISLLVFPTYRSETPTTTARMTAREVLDQLLVNSFPFDATGPIGFEALVRLADTVPGYRLLAGSLAEGVAAVNSLLDETRA